MKTLLLSLLILSQANAADLAHYEGMIYPRAQAYDGRIFEHRYSLGAQFTVEPAVKAEAQARVVEECDYNDGSVPVDCRKVCRVSLRAQIGQLQVSSRDLDTSLAVAQTKPVSAYAEATAPAENCTVTSAALGSASVEMLLFTLGKVELQVLSPAASPLATVSLVSMGGGSYELRSSPGASGFDAFWSFYETPAWSVSGPMQMDRVIR